MSVSKKSLGGMLLQIALGLFLLATGIMTLQLDGTFGSFQASLGGNEVANVIYDLLDGNLAKIAVIIIGICELLAGVFLLISLFTTVGKLADVVLFIIMVMWIIVIVLVDILGSRGILGNAFKSFSSIISYMKTLSGHLLVLGAILIVKRN